MTCRPLALLPLLVVGLAGCSGSVSVGNDVSGDEIAKQIRPEYVKQTGLELRKLDCDSPKGEKGAAISCKGENEKGVALDFGGELTETKGSKVRFHWKIVKALAPGRIYETAATEALNKVSSKPVESLACPARIEVATGLRVRCTARSAEGDSALVELTLTDGDGGFRARFVGR